MTRIRTRSESPVERKLTEIETHHVRDGETGGVEFVIEQSTYEVWSKRYAPAKLVLFTLSPDDAEALARELLNQAGQAREGREETPT